MVRLCDAWLLPLLFRLPRFRPRRLLRDIVLLKDVTSTCWWKLLVVGLTKWNPAHEGSCPVVLMCTAGVKGDDCDEDVQSYVDVGAECKYAAPSCSRPAEKLVTFVYR